MAGSRDEQTKLRGIYLEEGTGGIIDFVTINRNRNVPITHIATSNCLTCVGVCFPISSTQCFAAHILASTGRGTRRSDERWTPKSEAEGRELKRVVLDRLEAVVGRDMRSYDRAKKNVVLICPRPHVSEPGKKLTGHYVASAVCELLGIDEGSLNDRAQGFIVDDSGKVCTYLGLKANSDESDEQPEKHGFERVNEVVPDVTDWRLQLRDGEWKFVESYEESLVE